jgi:hypothetical protein
MTERSLPGQGRVRAYKPGDRFVRCRKCSRARNWHHMDRLGVVWRPWGGCCGECHHRHFARSAA